MIAHNTHHRFNSEARQPCEFILFQNCANAVDIHRVCDSWQDPSLIYFRGQKRINSYCFRAAQKPYGFIGTCDSSQDLSSIYPRAQTTIQSYIVSRPFKNHFELIGPSDSSQDVSSIYPRVLKLYKVILFQNRSKTI